MTKPKSNPEHTAFELTVVLDTRGNPDFGENPRRPVKGLRKRVVSVATIGEASRVCRTFIEANELGGGNWTGGQVFDYSGQHVAQISYNGRAWEVGEFPTPEIDPDAEPCNDCGRLCAYDDTRKGYRHVHKDARERGCFLIAPEPAVPPCAASMGCLCACHAAGMAASEACDTNEDRARSFARSAVRS
jgi:hypothetical protein